LCALDNPIVAGMQLFLVVNFLLLAVSTFLLLFKRLRRSPSLPPWCRAFSVAAIAVHVFWSLFCLLTLAALFAESPDEAAVFLLSPELAVFLVPSLLGVVLGWRVRHHAATDWTPALFSPPSAPTSAPGPSPHA
jgi:hypothetical protein